MTTASLSSVGTGSSVLSPGSGTLTTVSAKGTAQNSTQGATAQSSSSIVTLGVAGSASALQTYSVRSAPVVTAAIPVWKTPSNNAISAVMGSNYLAGSLTGRFQNLAGASLGIFKTGGGSSSINFVQSVMQAPPATEADAATAPATQNFSANDELTVKTASGVIVKVSLDTEGNGLTVKITSDGNLSDAERDALGKLSDAFQQAVDGLGASPPKLDLSGLTQFDPAVLASIDLHSDVTPAGQPTQTLAFHADSNTRSVKMTTPGGTVNVSVDATKAASLGNSKQHADAINSYLKQFDKAATRGQADGSLMTMFKDAFTQMNAQAATVSTQRAAPLTASDHAMLTGLADFTASITQAAKSGNPMRLNEIDAFAYQASQQTTIGGGVSSLNRTISQTQQSHLSASYHKSPLPEVPLKLTTLRESQNYDYTQIDDNATSAASIGYQKGLLTRATLTQSASQSTRVSKYRLGELTGDVTTPINGSTTQNILAVLAPFLKKGKLDLATDRAAWDKTLSDIHDAVLLQGDPADLHKIASA